MYWCGQTLNSLRIRIGFQFWLKTKRRETTLVNKNNTAIFYSKIYFLLKYLKNKINSTLRLVSYASAQSYYQMSDRHAKLFRLYEDSSTGHSRRQEAGLEQTSGALNPSSSRSLWHTRPQSSSILRMTDGVLGNDQKESGLWGRDCHGGSC